MSKGRVGAGMARQGATGHAYAGDLQIAQVFDLARAIADVFRMDAQPV